MDSAPMLAYVPGYEPPEEEARVTHPCTRKRTTHPPMAGRPKIEKRFRSKKIAQKRAPHRRGHLGKLIKYIYISLCENFFRFCRNFSSKKKGRDP